VNLVQSRDLPARARAAADIARSNAAAVDAGARFPGEAFAELRKQRLLGIMVPKALGGEGAGIAEIADICFIAGAGVCVDGTHLRDAPDQDGLHRAPRQGQFRDCSASCAGSRPNSC
jgi:alkylation response protein AidB-like acyl-CoA dehydrogenase